MVQLTNITGGGRLSEPLIATLIINPNDAPINFLYPLQVRVIEGQTANFTINLNRTLNHSVIVYFTTIDVSASASTGDYIPAINQSVVFDIGESRKTISVQTLNDITPEIAEDFIVRLTASTGDTVLIHPTEATVTIIANDVPYGIFEFSSVSLSNTASEGDTLSLV